MKLVSTWNCKRELATIMYVGVIHAVVVHQAEVKQI